MSILTPRHENQVNSDSHHNQAIYNRDTKTNSIEKVDFDSDIKTMPFFLLQCKNEVNDDPSTKQVHSTLIPNTEIKFISTTHTNPTQFRCPR